MVRRLNGRLPWLVACAAVVSLAFVSPALAQSTGMIRGVVAAGASPEMAAKSAAPKKTFVEGVTASRAGNHDAAIASFQQAAELNPNCYDCYYNIAYSESQKKDWDKAEAAYKKAIELKA